MKAVQRRVCCEYQVRTEVIEALMNRKTVHRLVARDGGGRS